MTSSNTLKKILSLGLTAFLSIGGSLIATESAMAAVSFASGPTVSPSGNVAANASLSSIGYGAWGGVPNNYAGGGPSVTGWKVCDTAPTVTHSEDGLDMPAGWNCLFVFTSLSGANPYNGTSLMLTQITALGSQGSTISNSYLVGKYIMRFDMSKNLSDNTIYGWAISTPQLIIAIPPTISGTTGNLNGSVGSNISMPAYTATSMAAPIVYSYTVGGGASLPAGLGFNTSTGQITGTPTVSASNVMVTITATDANSMTASASFNLTITGGGGGGGGTVYSMLSAPSYSISNGVATANDGTWSGGSNITRWWILCDNPITAPLTTTPPMDCFPMALTSNGAEERGTSVALQPVVWKGFTGSFTQVNLADKYLGLYVSNGGSRYVTLTNAGPAVAATTARPLSVEQARNMLKPVPAAVQPLVPAFLALNKPMASLGGSVALSAGDFTGLVSAKIANKSIDFILGKTGQITMTVPQGEAGKTADLTLTFNTGSIILQDAIKYVAPVVVANVPVRPVSIAAGSSKLSEEAADQIRHAALANLKNTNIDCVAYAAADTAAAKAAAKATATKACALAKKTNSDLIVSPITVVVDKLKARTQGVGIKVYKADN